MAKKKTKKKASKKAAKKTTKKASKKKVSKKVAKKATKKVAKKKAVKKVTKTTAKKTTAKKVTKKVATKKATKTKITIKEDVKGAQPEEVKTEDAAPADQFLTDAEGNRLCRVQDCDQAAIVDSYCRYHYLLMWKNIQVRKKILSEGKLESYIEELTARYPDKHLEALTKDLKTQKDFMGIIRELEIDESIADGDDDYSNDDNDFIEEIRGVTDAGKGKSDNY